MYKVYRVMNPNNFFDGCMTNSKPYELNANTYEYNDGEEYVHFFILPEQADLYKKMFYDEHLFKSVVLQCDIPEGLIKDGLGVGMYRLKEDTMMEPFLEVRLKAEDFDMSMVTSISEKMVRDWYNKEIYNKYQKAIEKIEWDKSPILVDVSKNVRYQTEVQPKLNPKFNFFDYFPREDMRKSRKYEYVYEETKVKRISKKMKEKIQKLLNRNKMR